MAFMILCIQKNMLTQQQSELQYQDAVATDKYQQVTDAMGVCSQNGTSDSNYAKALECYQEEYQSQMNSLEAQLKVIENEISSYDKALDSNIKSDCKFSISA